MGAKEEADGYEAERERKEADTAAERASAAAFGF